MAVPEDAVAVLAVLAAKFAVVRPVAGAAGGPGVKGAAAAGQLRLRGSSGWRCRAWQGQLAVLAEQAGPGGHRDVLPARRVFSECGSVPQRAGTVPHSPRTAAARQ
jgi:hypothetical protein